MEHSSLYDKYLRALIIFHNWATTGDRLVPQMARVSYPELIEKGACDQTRHLSRAREFDEEATTASVTKTSL